MKNKISIIIPVYNTEKYISKTLDCLISQSYKNIEIICINDGSIDNSWNILQEYAKKDNRIKIFTQKNSGPAKARNVGLSNATGQFLMFCDSDDYYELTMCEEMLNSIIEQNVDFVICDCNVIEVDKNHGRGKGTVDYQHLQFFEKIILTDYIKVKINILLWNKIFKMSLIKQYNITFPEGYESEDNAFIYQYLSVANDVYGLDKKLYNYNLFSNSVMGRIYSKKSLHNLFDVIYSLKFSINFMKKNNLLEKNKWIIQVFLNQINWIFDIIPREEKKTFLEKINMNILCYFSEDDLIEYPFLFECKQENYEKIISTLSNVKRFKLFGISIFKIKQKNNIIKYYFLGIKLFSRKMNK